jgi:glycosyltransferase involved in cell wall biosynthesis
LAPPKPPSGNFVSIAVPAYREEEHIESTLSGIVAELRGAELAFEVLVILDSVPGDETGRIARRLCGRFDEIKLIERLGRRGVGDAIRTAISAAKGEIFVPVMGDRSESAPDLVKLINAVARGHGMAVGERFGYGRPPGYPRMKYIANRLYNYLIKFLFRLPYSDATNAFKAYRLELLRQLDLSSKGFEIFAEIPIKFALRWPSARIARIPVQHFVRGKREAKLSLLRDGPRYIKIILSLFLRYKIRRAFERP